MALAYQSAVLLVALASALETADSLDLASVVSDRTADSAGPLADFTDHLSSLAQSSSRPFLFTAVTMAVESIAAEFTEATVEAVAVGSQHIF